MMRLVSDLPGPGGYAREILSDTGQNHVRRRNQLFKSRVPQLGTFLDRQYSAVANMLNFATAEATAGLQMLGPRITPLQNEPVPKHICDA